MWLLGCCQGVTSKHVCRGKIGTRGQGNRSQNHLSCPGHVQGMSGHVGICRDELGYVGIRRDGGAKWFVGKIYHHRGRFNLDGISL